MGALCTRFLLKIDRRIPLVRRDGIETGKTKRPVPAELSVHGVDPGLSTRFSTPVDRLSGAALACPAETTEATPPTEESALSASPSRPDVSPDRYAQLAANAPVIELNVV